MKFLDNFKKSFKVYVNEDQSIPLSSKSEIHSALKNNLVETVFAIVFTILVWTAFASVVDIILISEGSISFVFDISQRGIFMDFLPSLIFFFVGVLVRLFIVLFFARRNKRVKISNFQKSLVIIPYIGWFFFMLSVLKGRPIFLSALHDYVKYLKESKKVLKTFIGRE